MRLPIARRLAPACMVSAAAVAALAAPGAANAALGHAMLRLEHHGPGLLAAEGRADQRLEPGLQHVDQKQIGMCRRERQGTLAKPTVTYTSTGSGAGLEAWGVNKKTPNYTANAFVGTDEPPNAAQIAEIEANETKARPGNGREHSGRAGVGRGDDPPAGQLRRDEQKRQRSARAHNVAPRGHLPRHDHEVEPAHGTTGRAVGYGLQPRNGDHPVVRKDQSGTTHIFKKYLSLIDGTTFTTEAPKEQTDWTKSPKALKTRLGRRRPKSRSRPPDGGGALIEGR